MSNQPYTYARIMKTNRSMIMFVLLSFITCGIYSIIFFSMLSDDVNFVARARDGKKTMHYCLLFFIVGPITCDIVTFVWFHNISRRIGEEARMRGIRTNFGAAARKSTRLNFRPLP